MRRQVIAAILGAAVALLLVSGPVSHAQLVPVPPGATAPPVMVFPASAVNGAGVDSTAHLTFSPDATWDIGASGATRPRNFYMSGSEIAGGNIQAGGFVPITGIVTSAGTLLSGSAFLPTISSGFGTSPSVVTPNGTASFTVNVGTGGAATSGVIAMNVSAAPPTGWTCHVNNITAAAAHRADNTRQTASSTTTATLENQTTSTGAAVAWTASDILRVSCFGF